MKKHQYTGFWILVVLIFLALFISTLFKDKAMPPQDLMFSEFIGKVRQRQISKVEISGNIATGTATATAKAVPALPTQTEETPGGSLSPVPSGNAPGAFPDKYRVVLPDGGVGVSLLVPELQRNNIPFRFSEPKADGQWLGILTSVFLPLIFLVFLFMIFRNAQGGGSQALSFGKSRAKMAMDSKVKITFNDVAGIDEAKAELEEVVDFLKNAERYQKLGAKIPKGVLLVGSPGTGKTLLAKAVAGEAGVPFFSISGSDFVEMFVGVGASRVRDLFEQAKKHAPCIIFVDEIDAVGRQRGAGMGGGHDEREQTLNQLLVEMDGFDPHTGIIVLAATNRPDILDNALLRPGRFDRQVMIDRPDVQGREQILKVHAKGKPLASDVDLKLLAKRTPGFTGADLSNLLNEGALMAARQNKDVIHMADIENSIDKVLAGPEKKNKIMTEKDKELTAYHEVGHALVAVMTPGCDPLRKVTIIPRGMALGLTWTMPDADKVHVTKQQLYATIAMALGGRAAEEVVFKDITTGASNDLEKVTSLARRIVTAYGMNDKLGPITYGRRNEHPFMGRDFGTERDYGEEVATVIDREVKRIVDIQYDYARNLLTENRDVLDGITKILLEKETLDDKEFMDIVEEIKASRGNGSGRLLKEKLDATVKDERGLVIAPGVDEPYPVDSATKHEEAGQKN
jgi:cell division protease FtsH